jgi:anti-sigma regulatory factor (Ser/Thr protein kinase)
MESKDDRDFDVTVSAGPRAPARARNAIARWLSGHVTSIVLEDAVLLVSELVTNSTRHASAPDGATIRVRGTLGDRLLRVQVLDRGQQGAVAGRDPRGVELGGYGLQLVASLASDWGVRRGLGTEVWFELATAATNGNPARQRLINSDRAV